MTARKPEPAPRNPESLQLAFPLSGILPAILICLISLCAFFFGAVSRGESTLFLENRTMEGYLSPVDYILVDEVSGKPVQNLHALFHPAMSSLDHMITNRGIRTGSSWQDVLNAYGEFTVRSITFHPGCKDLRSIRYDNAVFVNEPMKLSEFETKYVLSGLCNPDTDRIYISFELPHDGFRLYYPPEEQNNANSHKRAFRLSISCLADKGVNYISASCS